MLARGATNLRKVSELDPRKNSRESGHRSPATNNKEHARKIFMLRKLEVCRVKLELEPKWLWTLRRSFLRSNRVSR